MPRNDSPFYFFVERLGLASFAFAQSKIDFSGVFLRTQSSVAGQVAPAVPRILDIRQTTNEVVVTATQNGETAVAHYPLHGKKSDKVKAQLKGENLVIKATVEQKWLNAGLPVSPVVAERLEEKWQLSPDAQTLILSTKSDTRTSNSDIYTREPSLELAQTAALGAKKNCNAVLPIPASKGEMATTLKYDAGADLGMTSFEQITQCAFYDAVLSGHFFKNLERTRKDPVQFRKKGQPVTIYSGDVVLEVQPTSSACLGESGPWQHIGPQQPEAVQELRFMVRWVGAEQRDLGEIQSEFLHEPWREQSPPVVFYRMRIPAQDIPLTDDLEVTIFSKSGEQLACVKQHI